MARLARFCRLSCLGATIAGATACGQSTSSGEGRGSDETGGSAGRAGNGAFGGDGGSAGSTGGSSASGASGSAGTGGSGNPGGAPSVDISGPWAMFAFEDPVAVSLSQNGTELSGFGCCAGLNQDVNLVECCGEIVGGSIVGGRAVFEFSFMSGLDYTYGADVLVSADGRRMLGSFNRGALATAWVPITGSPSEGIGWLRGTDAGLDDVVLARAGSYELSLTGAPAAGSDFAPDTPYALTISNSRPALVYGDLGPFWAGEMAWLESEQTLVIGPVPTTDPAYPVALRLRYEDIVLSAVEARMSSGDRYLFSATLP